MGELCVVIYPHRRDGCGEGVIHLLAERRQLTSFNVVREKVPTSLCHCCSTTTHQSLLQLVGTTTNNTI